MIIKNKNGITVEQINKTGYFPSKLSEENDGFQLNDRLYIVKGGKIYFIPQAGNISASMGVYPKPVLVKRLTLK